MPADLKVRHGDGDHIGEPIESSAEEDSRIEVPVDEKAYPEKEGRVEERRETYPAGVGSDQEGHDQGEERAEGSADLEDEMIVKPPGGKGEDGGPYDKGVEKADQATAGSDVRQSHGRTF